MPNTHPTKMALQCHESTRTEKWLIASKQLYFVKFTCCREQSGALLWTTKTTNSLTLVTRLVHECLDAFRCIQLKHSSITPCRMHMRIGSRCALEKTPSTMAANMVMPTPEMISKESTTAPPAPRD